MSLGAKASRTENHLERMLDNWWMTPAGSATFKPRRTFHSGSPKWIKCCTVLTTRGPVIQRGRPHLTSLQLLCKVNTDGWKRHTQQAHRHKSHMLRHPSLPFSSASMSIVLTQTHPSPIVALTYAHTHTHTHTHTHKHQTSLLLACAQRDANTPSFPPHLSLSFVFLHERNTWCLLTGANYWEVLGWCLQEKWHHALCSRARVCVCKRMYVHVYLV